MPHKKIDTQSDSNGGMLAAFCRRQAKMLGKVKARLHPNTRHSKTAKLRRADNCARTVSVHSSPSILDRQRLHAAAHDDTANCLSLTQARYFTTGSGSNNSSDLLGRRSGRGGAGAEGAEERARRSGRRGAGAEERARGSGRAGAGAEELAQMSGRA